MAFGFRKKSDIEAYQELLLDQSEDDDNYNETGTSTTNQSSSERPMTRSDLLHVVSAIGLCQSVLLFTILCAPILIGFLIFEELLSIPAIVFGFIYEDQCPAESRIPFCIIIYSITSFIKGLISLKNNWNNIKNISRHRKGDRQQNKKSNDDHKSTGISRTSILIFSTAQMITFLLFMASSYLVFHIFRTVDTSDSNSPHYCNKYLYWYSFWFLILKTLYTLIFCSCMQLIFICNTI